MDKEMLKEMADLLDVKLTIDDEPKFKFKMPKSDMADAMALAADHMKKLDKALSNMPNLGDPTTEQPETWALTRSKIESGDYLVAYDEEGFEMITGKAESKTDSGFWLSMYGRVLFSPMNKKQKTYILRHFQDNGLPSMPKDEEEAKLLGVEAVS